MSKSVTVSTKKEFEDAVNKMIDKIIVTGKLALDIIAAQKKKAIAKKLGVGSIALVGASTLFGVVSAPFTGGASLAASTAVSNMVITIGGLKVTAGAAEVVAAVIGILGTVGIAANVVKTIVKNYDINISSGSSRVELTRK